MCFELRVCVAYTRRPVGARMASAASFSEYGHEARHVHSAASQSRAFDALWFAIPVEDKATLRLAASRMNADSVALLERILHTLDIYLKPAVPADWWCAVTRWRNREIRVDLLKRLNGRLREIVSDTGFQPRKPVGMTHPWQRSRDPIEGDAERERARLQFHRDYPTHTMDRELARVLERIIGVLDEAVAARWHHQDADAIAPLYMRLYTAVRMWLALEAGHIDAHVLRQ